MKLLHTGDWHIGKRLYGVDRGDECRAALAELAQIARDERVDAVLMSGDLMDRRLVDSEALGDCLQALEALATVAPVLAVVGNHDDPGLWGAFAPYLALRRIHVAHRVARPDDAVVTVDTAAGPLHAALMPWPEPGRAARELGVDIAEAKGSYADLVRVMLDHYGQALERRRAAEGGVTALVAHLMVDGAVGGGGEREMTLGITYCVSPQALPSTVDYVALGHVHRPQAVPGVAVPARYAGSPMAIDFSEDNHTKSACIVEVDGVHTTVREVPLTASRPLVRLRSSLQGLADAAAAAPGGWYLCEVLLDGPVLDLVHQVREQVPDTLRVEPVYRTAPTASPAPGADGEGTAVTSVADQYADWYAAQGRVLSDAQRAAFEEAVAAARAAEGDA